MSSDWTTIGRFEYPEGSNRATAVFRVSGTTAGEVTEVRNAAGDVQQYIGKLHEPCDQRIFTAKVVDVALDDKLFAQDVLKANMLSEWQRVYRHA